ncbi:YraN family protein [Anoxynatronum sibiricum]|uniref:UPF0102 protein AAIG11_03150 n=1 Tax=Anoxynatronum sibiricum TaxID=210623 RepID=A0ABU9VSP1_9CLOT
MNQVTGKAGEQAALLHLIKNGYQLVCRNYRCRLGEVDLIMRRDHILIFVEVKTRKSTQYGLPRESVTYAKQKKIYQIAQQYIQRYRINHLLFRFDVIEILCKNGEEQINHIENAFTFNG